MSLSSDIKDQFLPIGDLYMLNEEFENAIEWFPDGLVDDEEVEKMLNKGRDSVKYCIYMTKHWRIKVCLRDSISVHTDVRLLYKRRENIKSSLQEWKRKIDIWKKSLQQ